MLWKYRGSKCQHLLLRPRSAEHLCFSDGPMWGPQKEPLDSNKTTLSSCPGFIRHGVRRSRTSCVCFRGAAVWVTRLTAWLVNGQSSPGTLQPSSKVEMFPMIANQSIMSSRAEVRLPGMGNFTVPFTFWELNVMIQLVCMCLHRFLKESWRLPSWAPVKKEKSKKELLLPDCFEMG